MQRGDNGCVVETIHGTRASGGRQTAAAAARWLLEITTAGGNNSRGMCEQHPHTFDQHTRIAQMLVKSQAAAAAAAAPRWARALSATAPTRDASATTSAAPPRATPRAAPLPTRSVLEVSGPDAQKFLKGQMCKDVESLGGGYSGFLNASVCFKRSCSWTRRPPPHPQLTTN